MLDPNIPKHITASSGPSGKVFMSMRKFDVQLPICQEHMGGKLPSFVFAIAVGRFAEKGLSNGYRGMFNRLQISLCPRPKRVVPVFG